MYCKFCGKECKNKNSLRNHERLCKENPNKSKSNICEYNKYRKENNIHGENQYTKALKTGNEYHITEETRKKLSIISSQRRHTDETKRKISESMKLSHKNGLAHNIGKCRWNNEPSYPEKWFMEVIENEFDNKNYVREYPFLSIH